MLAIENASKRVLRKARPDDVGTNDVELTPEQHITDLQQETAASAAPVHETNSDTREESGERLIKGYLVSSVNEWGAEQTRILLMTDEALHRVKYDFTTDQVVKWTTDKYQDILRIEYGSFTASSSSITSFLWRREIDDQQGFRVYTHGPSNTTMQEKGREHLEANTPQERFREYRALLAEAEPWKEEVFMLEFVAALQAVKILYKARFEIKLTKMVKSIPGGIFTLLHNANRRRQHGTR
jgi:hypothetical protein